MPRPIVQGVASPPGADTPFEYPVAVVDAPDAYYYVARVQIAGNNVTVYDQGWDLMARYVFDDTPTYDPSDGAVVGKVGGLGLLIRRDQECGCNGTRMVPK